MIKILVAGFTGAMGKKVLRLIDRTDNYQLVAAYAPSATDPDPTYYHLDKSVKIFHKLDEIKTDADVWIDFTLPSSVFADTQFAIQHGIHPVIGTSGLKDEQLKQLTDLAKIKHLGGIIAPNFGISAILLMKFAKEAAKYYPHAEIIEMHHADKRDAPSGTALNTAKLINQVRPEQPTTTEETLAGVRGGDYHGIKIHSVRLPGYVAHEQVLFGGPGEALTIRQDSFDRDSFMQGVKVATDKVQSLDHLIVGLETIL